MPRRLLLAAVAALTLSVSLVAVAVRPAADARATGGTCKGTRVLAKNLMLKGTKIGELGVYYDRGTGVKCAILAHAGPTYGKRLDTKVSITRCKRGTVYGRTMCGIVDAPGAHDEDEGRFTTYAGPAHIRARKSCILVSGWIVYKRKARTIATSDRGRFCG